MCTIQPLCLGAERPDHRAEAVGLVSVLRAHHSGRGLAAVHRSSEDPATVRATLGDGQGRSPRRYGLLK